MKLHALLLAVLAAAVVTPPAAGTTLPLLADSPFRIYSVAEGLNQKTVHAVVQDNDGFLWIATFGGLNRFDGRTFESLTTREGLRQNLIQALRVDAQNRLWAGDAGGGLTLIENGKVVRTFEPDEASRGVVRAIIDVGDTLYIGSQPGGIRTLSLNDMDSGFQHLESAPDEIYTMDLAGDDTLYLISPAGLQRLKVTGGTVFEEVGNNLTAVATDRQGRVAVGDADGRIGWLQGDRIDWLDVNYEDRISGLVLDQGTLKWVFLEELGMFRFGDKDPSELGLAIAGTAQPLRDQEGLFWVPTRSGLARYLGPRFDHYSLEFEGRSPEVFAVRPGVGDGFWFGTNLGLLYLDGGGELINVSDELGIDRREVRDIRITRNGSTLWFGQVQGAVHGIDPVTRALQKTLAEDTSLTVGLTLDHRERLWIGSFLGTLTRYDPETEETRTYTIGKSASVYSLDMADDSHLWFSANFAGVFRIDTDDPDAAPERMASDERLQQEYYTHVVASGSGAATDVWFAGIKGSVFRLRDGELSSVFTESTLSNVTMYSIQPLPDDNLVLATSRGAYRYALATDTLERYGALDGFVALESKVHAMYYDGGDDLWIGTSSGLTVMDLTVPFDGVTAPAVQITARRVDGVAINSIAVLDSLSFDEVVIDFTAVSTRKPDGIEYSYQLAGHDAAWSDAARTTSISYSNLPPGDFTFGVRARLPGGEWSSPASWPFTVPTPVWRMPWFIAAAVLATLALVWSAVQLRLRSIANANLRLRQEVAERTESIEAGRRELELTNEQLSSEILERKKSDALRAEVEARFHQAYQNSPIGMALVDTDGLVYDANPRMKALFWPESDREQRKPLLTVVSDEDRAEFSDFLADYAADRAEVASMEAGCLAHDGAIRRIDFHPSAVRNQDGELRYIVLLAHDVTENRAMTDQLAYQARFDELTGLFNRRAFAERLTAVGEEEKPSAYLMFLDLDQFKVVNDTCGHAAGDELLCMVADALRACVRKADTVARLGGDEFAMIIVGCSEETALRRAETVRQHIQDLKFFWENDVFRVGASIGVVPIGAGSRDLNELQQLADAACYAAKDAGRNRVHMVTGAEDEVHAHRGEMRWVQRLNHAIDNENFELYGQRILPLADDHRSIERIEILLRMRDPVTRRLIPPGAFLPAAERYGLHGRLDQWVVGRVIESMAGQLASEVENREFWVNLSGASVGDPTVSRELIRMVEAADLPRGSLNFEITETAVIRKIGEAKQLIAALRAMGCRFALDDFGSGLSSFSHLRQLSVDCLKVDGQFIRDIGKNPTDRIFVKSIIDIAHTLDMTVTTEFVEDDDILGIVQSLGSDYAQGFGIHRPEPLNAMVSETTEVRVSGLNQSA